MRGLDGSLLIYTPDVVFDIWEQFGHPVLFTEKKPVFLDAEDGCVFEQEIDEFAVIYNTI